MKRFYDTESEGLLLLHYSRLSEKHRRHYAALECKKLGFGSQIYIRSLLKISQKTIERGLLELSNPAIYNEIPAGKIRRKGGGRKKIL